MFARETMSADKGSVKAEFIDRSGELRIDDASPINSPLREVEVKAEQ